MNECPICGADHHCLAVKPGTVFGVWDPKARVRVETSIDGAVMCMNSPGKCAGFEALGNPGPSGGQYFIPSGTGVALSADEVAERQARWRKEEEAAKREAEETKRYAVSIWRDALPADDRAAAYLAGRGVPGMVSGDVLPESLRYVESLEYTDKGRRLAPGPAIVACVTNAAGVITGIHRLYLARDGSPAKRAAADCGEKGAKVALGSLGGGAVRLGGDPAAKTLVLCEGIETGMMILAASPASVEGGAWEVWSCISGGGMGAVQLDEPTAARVTRIVVAGDLDKWAEKRGHRPGHHYAALAAERLHEKFPALDVRVAIPGHADLPEAVDQAGAPRGVAGADWLDVGQDELCGMGKVLRGILDAREVVGQPDKAEWEEQRTRASAQGSPVVGGEEGDGAGSGTRASAQGSSDAGNGEVGDGEARTRASEAGDDDDGDGEWNPNGYWVEEGKPILPKGDLPRARIAIRECFMPPEGRRIAERFTIAWWGNAQQWLRWDGRRYEPVHADVLRGMVLDFFESWFVKNKDGQLGRAGLSTHQAASIVEALKTDCTIDSEGLPCWAPPTIGSDGRPIFDTRREVPKGGGLCGRPVVAFQNGVLDLDALRERREVVLAEPSTLLISTNVMPFDLPVDEIRAELAEDERGESRGGPLCARLAPKWTGFLGAASKDDDDFVRCLQQYFGYLLSPTCEFEKFLYLVGAPGVGKGTILDAATAMVGQDATASSRLGKIAGRFDFGPMLGKKLLLLDEMGAGSSTDLVEATGNLLSIVGNALMSVDLKNRDAMPAVALGLKVIATGNRLQKFADASGAFGRRLLIVRIPKVGPSDPAFKGKIKAEARGIMVWALFGLMDLWKSGAFVQPACGMELRTMFLRMSSRVRAFVEDCAVVESGFEGDAGQLSVKASLLYQLFEKWCESQGMRVLQMEDFASDLMSAVEEFKVDRLTVGADQFAVWRGVRPRLRLDLTPREEWTDADRALSAMTVTAPGQVAGVVAGSAYHEWDNRAAFAPMGFNFNDTDQTQDNLPG